MQETAEHSFVIVPESVDDELGELVPDSKEAHELIAQLTHGLGEGAVNAIGIVVTKVEGVERGVAYTSLDPSDPGTHYRTKEMAEQLGPHVPYGIDLPPPEKVYQSLRAAQEETSATDIEDNTTEDLDENTQARQAFEKQRHAEREAALNTYEAALNDLTETLDKDFLEPEASTRGTLDTQIQDLRQAINNARLYGGDTYFGDYFGHIRKTLDQRRGILTGAQAARATFQETSERLVKNITTEDETDALLASNLNRISNEHRNGSNIDGALTIALDEQARQEDAVRIIEQALDMNDTETARYRFNELDELLHNHAARAYAIRASIEQSRSSFYSLKRSIEGEPIS